MVKYPKAGSQSRVVIFTKDATGDGYHAVHWGNGSTFNRNLRRFRLLRSAKSFAQKISLPGGTVKIVRR